MGKALAHEDRDVQRQRHQWPPARLLVARDGAPDVACLQELKAPDEPSRSRHRPGGYGAIWHGQKSWNGVAILARGEAPLEIRRGLPGDPDDTHSRYIEAVLADPERFHDRTLADPLEGRAYGRGKAKVYRNSDSSVVINSFAHGGIVYRLQHDAAFIEAQLNQAGEDAPFMLAALMAHARDIDAVTRERQFVTDAGVHHRVVDVADHHIAAGWRRQEQEPLALELDRRGHLERRLVPDYLGRRGYREPQICAEVAVAVRDEPLFGPSTAHGDLGTGYPLPGQAACEIAQHTAEPAPSFPIDPANQKPVGLGAVTSVRLQHDAARRGSLRTLRFACRTRIPPVTHRHPQRTAVHQPGSDWLWIGGALPGHDVGGDQYHDWSVFPDHPTA